jgi:hypothetical protein
LERDISFFDDMGTRVAFDAECCLIDQRQAVQRRGVSGFHLGDKFEGCPNRPIVIGVVGGVVGGRMISLGSMS